MAKSGLYLILLVVAGFAGVFFWQQQRLKHEQEARERAELRAGLDATRVINLKFENTVSLGVRHVSGTMMTRTASSGCLFELCSSTQETRAPFSIDYLLDLKQLPASAYRWDSQSRTIFVEVPDVRLSTANVDMSRAQVKQDGIWISRRMGLEMQRSAAKNLAGKTVAVAQEPDNMKQARDAARRAVASIVRAPLQAAGLGNVDVQVRLAFDPRPGGYKPWDMSRPIAEVLADPRLKP